MEKQGYRPKQAADYLGISLSSFWNYVRAGKLHTIKLSANITVVTKTELDSLLVLKGEI
jgi:predicted site-specific integrase-resolvase